MYYSANYSLMILLLLIQTFVTITNCSSTGIQWNEEVLLHALEYHQKQIKWYSKQLHQQYGHPIDQSSRKLLMDDEASRQLAECFQKLEQAGVQRSQLLARFRALQGQIQGLQGDGDDGFVTSQQQAAEDDDGGYRNRMQDHASVGTSAIGQPAKSPV